MSDEDAKVQLQKWSKIWEDLTGYRDIAWKRTGIKKELFRYRFKKIFPG
jgi:hypothetical protein